MVKKPIDWSIYTPGGTGVGQTQRPGQTTNMADYTTLYNQQQNVGYNNTGSGVATGSPFAMSGKPFVSPYDFHDSAGFAEIPTANDPIANLQKTQGEVFTEAQARYLAMATENRDLTRQGIQQTGADQYSQARMAMEQQMALSDTRGLTAGAKEGAQQTLSATQQVALNQIESNIQSQLLELKAQGVQDEFLAQEYGMRQLEINKQLNPEWGKLEILTNNFNAALQLGDQEAAQKALNSMNETSYALLGLDASDIDTNNPNLSIDATRDKLIQRMSQDPSVSDQVWSWVAAFGAIGAGGLMMGAGFFLTPMGIGVPLSVVGAGLMSYGAHLSKVAGDQNLSMERKIQKVNEILAAQRKEFINLGYSPEVVDAELNKYRQTLIPAFQ